MKSSATIPTYHFLARKYGRELLLDVGRIESLRNFVRDDTPHQISFYEILFIEKGKGSFSLDEHTIHLKPGTVVFTSPGQTRRWHAHGVKGYTLFFETDFLRLFFTDEMFLYRFQYFHQYDTPTAMHLRKPDFGQAEEIVQHIEQEFLHIQNDSTHLLRALLYQLLVTLNRYYAARYHLQRDTQVHPDFYRFRSLLEKEFRTHHRVTDYTSRLRISATQLNKLCRQYGGQSAQQMIHLRLVYEIKKQLRGSLSVKEIAYTFGFSDPSNFNRFFKKMAGVTPLRYREDL